MLHLLWLIPLLPARRLRRAGAARPAPRRTAASPSSAPAPWASPPLVALAVALDFIARAAGRPRLRPGPLDLVRRRPASRPQVAFYLDAAVARASILVVTCRRLPHPPLLGRAHGATTRATRRFFAYMNLFVGLMLVLVLADNLLLLYLAGRAWACAATC